MKYLGLKEHQFLKFKAQQKKKKKTFKSTY
jgi:hypothetical protein